MEEGILLGCRGKENQKRETMTMNAYYVLYPRDFTNEYTVYVAGDAESADYLRNHNGAKRISRREAIRLGWTRPRQARKTGEQWYGGFAGDNYYDTLAEAIEAATFETSCLVTA
jgi:hypothetical protein